MMLLCLFVVLVILGTATQVFCDESNLNSLLAQVQGQKEALADYRAKLDASMAEIRRANNDRVRAAQAFAQEAQDKAKSLQESAPSTPFSIESSTDNSDSSAKRRLIFDQEQRKAAKDRITQLREESKSRKSQSGNLQSILSRHAVDNKLVEELSRMAASSIPHDSMVQHVKQHFPEKRPDEWNDIVIAALGTRHRRLETMDNQRSKQIESENRRQRYERMKASYEAQQS